MDGPQTWQDWELDVEDAVDALEEAVGGDGRPSWGTWQWDGGPIEVHEHPEDLVGLVAPPWVVAVGVSSGGRAHRLDADGPTQRCRVSCVVARDGRVAARLRIGGDLVADPPEEGRVLDTLRRCVGVPTAPPPGPLRPATVVLVWLRALVADPAARPARRRRTWAQVAARHPAAVVAAGTDPVAGTDPAALAAVTAALSWEDLRLLVACGAAVLPGTTPAVAAWMDDGMLAREVLGGGDGDDGVVGRALRVIDDDARARLEEVLRLLPAPAGP